MNFEIDQEIPHKAQLLAVQHKKRVSAFGVLVLIGAIIGGASIPPFMNLYGDVSTFTKNFWRCQMNFLISIPLVLYTTKFDTESIDYSFLFSLKGVSLLLLSGMLFAGACGTYIASAWLTITSHTVVLGSIAGVIIIIYKLFTCQSSHSLEKVGTLLVIIGAIILMTDPNVAKTGEQEVSVTGEFLALSTSCFYALYYPLNRYLIKRVPGSIVLMCIAISSFIWFFITNMVWNDIGFHRLFSLDPDFGLFGWLSDKNLMTSIVLVAPFTWLLGNGAVLLSLKYFEPQVVGNASLLEPLIGQFLSYLLGQDELPGILTYVGAFIVVTGIYIVTQGSNIKDQDTKSVSEKESSEHSIEKSLLF